jgi:nucleoside-diphosphate-sugar epimerase
MAATVLVTGGFGFIGAHVVQLLLRAGRRVVVIARQVDGNSADEILDADERRAVDIIANEIPVAGELAVLLRRHQVDLIVHLASPLSVHTEGDPDLAVTGMVLPQLSILDAARDAGVRKVVWASSVGVFGRTSDYVELPIPNDAPHYPLTLYGAAKSFLERFSSQYTEAHGLQTLGLRFPLVYGPGRRRGGGQFTTRLIEGAALGQEIVAEGVDARFNWLYVADAARSVQLSLDAPAISIRALTISGESATVGEVADLLSDWFPGARRRDQPGSSELVADYDPAPALEAIGFAPLTGLRAGVLATVNAARRRAGMQLVA